jgi:hypothetical protein
VVRQNYIARKPRCQSAHSNSRIGGASQRPTDIEWWQKVSAIIRNRRFLNERR